MNDLFVAASDAVRCAWNSFPIDGIDIIRSIPIIGQKLRFPLDISLSALPSLVSNNAKSVISYFYLGDSNRFFVSVIFKILVANRRTAHLERIGNSRNIITMHPSDIVMTRTPVQMDKTKDKVVKNCCAVRGPFRIIRGSGRGSYIVRK